MMNLRAMMAITRKDVSATMRSRNALMPMLALPAVVFVLLPVAVIMIGYMVGNGRLNVGEILGHAPNVPIPAGYDDMQTLAYLLLMYYLAPLYMLIPALVADVAAAASFVGEREQRTLEGLLATPVSDVELIVAKAVAALVPSVGCSLITAVIYSAVVDWLGFGLFDGPIFPNAQWLVMAFLTAPLTALLSVLIVIFISQRSRTVMDAQGLGMIVLVPFIGLLAMQVSGGTSMDMHTIVVTTVAIAVVDAVMLWFVARTTDSESMLTSRR